MISDRENRIYHFMMLLFAVVVCIVSLADVSLFTLLNVRKMGMLAFIFADILMFIQLFNEKHIRVKTRICHFIYACIATIVYMMYCRNVFGAAAPGTTDDALSIAGILCLMFVFIRKG